jgi:putative tricarboxylic transport membrane protein
VALLSGFGIYALFANVLQVYLPTAGVPFLADMGL